MGAQHGWARSGNGPRLSMGTCGSLSYMGHSVVSWRYELSEILDEAWHLSFVLLLVIENAVIMPFYILGICYNVCNCTKEVFVLHPFPYATWTQAHLATKPGHWRSLLWAFPYVGDYLVFNVVVNLSPPLKLARGRRAEATAKWEQMQIASLQASTSKVLEKWRCFALPSLGASGPSRTSAADLGAEMSFLPVHPTSSNANSTQVLRSEEREDVQGQVGVCFGWLGNCTGQIIHSKGTAGLSHSMSRQAGWMLSVSAQRQDTLMLKLSQGYSASWNTDTNAHALQVYL